MTTPTSRVKSRGERFATRLKTQITAESPSEKNPYLVDSASYYGYEHFELMEKCSYSDVMFLLFRGELPTKTESEIFRSLSIAMINPGPRHPATQASIAAGVGKTLPVHILPIAMGIYGGDADGAADVNDAIQLFRMNHTTPPDVFTNQLVDIKGNPPPGFGSIYGDPDTYAEKLLHYFQARFPGPLVSWVWELHRLLVGHGLGILRSGVCAAILAELKFPPRQGCTLMQLMAAPGLAAHGLEYSNKPINKMLFESDDVYEIEESKVND